MNMLIPPEKEPSPYQMRGNPVPYLEEALICEFAKLLAKEFKISKKTPKQMTKLLDHDLVIWSAKNRGIPINIDPIEDIDWTNKWRGLSKACYYPEDQTIQMSEGLYMEAMRGEHDGIRVLVHELGHYFLCHDKSPHHFALTDQHGLCKEIDAEWQADIFALYFCKFMGIDYDSFGKQMRLF